MMNHLQMATCLFSMPFAGSMAKTTSTSMARDSLDPRIPLIVRTATRESALLMIRF